MAKKPTYDELEQRIEELERGTSNERSRVLFEHDPDAIFLENMGDRIIDANPSACRLLGYTRDELLKMTVQDLQAPDIRGTLGSVIRSESEKYRDLPFEGLNIHKNGTPIPVEIKTVPLPKEGFVLSIVRDITERKNAEMALRESEEKYRTILESIEEAYLEVDLAGNFTFFNDSLSVILGYSKEELKEMNNRDYMPPETAKEIYNLFQEIYRTGKPIRKYGYEVIRKGGTQGFHELFASLMRDGNGKPIGFRGIAHDITDRKQAEEALQESEQWIRNIFKSIKEAVFVITPDRIFLDMNEAALEMFGYTKEELVNLPSDIAHLDHEHYLEFGKKMEEVLNTVGVTNFQFKMRRKNGEIFPSEHTASLMVDNEGKPIGIVSVIRDLSEQKKIEEEKEKLRTQLEESKKMEAIGTLAGGIAHEFNNALTGVVGNIELLEMRLPDNKIVTEHTEAMKSSSHRMANLTSQLLAYARGGSYQAKTISLSDFVEKTFPVIKPNIGPSIRIDTDLPRDIFKVNVDSVQMQMVLSAVVSNSSEAIEGDGCIRVITSNEKIDAGFAKSQPELTPGHYVCLTVEDDGKGMDEETLSKIFDPFYSTKFIGRGLGMAAVYGIVRNHGGSISVDSDLGKGTVVRIYFPAFEDIEEELSEKSDEEAGVITGTGTILVIEDEEMVMNVIRAVLERLGYRMLEAKTGREAVEIAETFDGDIDLALLDIKLPDIQGDKVYPLIMKARPNLKVIVCSGYSIDTARGILDAGAQDFIQKPFSVKEISQKLKEILDKE